MGANTGLNSRSKNFYGIADGMLTQNRSDIMENFEEITQDAIKSARKNFTPLDLRGKYVKRDKDKYQYKHYFSSITGRIVNATKFEDKVYGMFLNIDMIDKDGDDSQISMKFYGKYAENLLNRLLATDLSRECTLAPYSMPDDYKPEGGSPIKYFNQGVTVYQDEEKITGAYDEESGLPPTERVENPADGSIVTSRTKRVNFLWESLEKMLNSKNEEVPVVVDIEEEDDDLPF